MTTFQEGLQAKLAIKAQRAREIALARSFCARLIAYLGTDLVAKIAIENATEVNPQICHSHDYCDANQFMIDAMAEVYPEIDFLGAEGLESVEAFNEHFKIVDTAWGIAKSHGFVIPNL